MERTSKKQNVPAFDVSSYSTLSIWNGFYEAVFDFIKMTVPARISEGRQMLDIGCGDGHVTREVLLPRSLPCRRLVATDVSSDMVGFARANFPHPKISYDLLDVSDSGDVKRFMDTYGRFERVYSVCCLNWVRDQTSAFGNIASLMTDDGDCVLLYPAVGIIRGIWQRLAATHRWSRFTDAFKSFTTRSFQLTDDESLMAYVRDLLEGAGLYASTCELLRFDWLDTAPVSQLAQYAVSISPVHDELTEEEKVLLQEDVEREMTTLKSLGREKADTAFYLIRATRRRKN
ncbi:juvenile hormone acid O-methyltransferase-like [Dermacentor variabilis]|uniref:juvenile hormone acid O-methyltransferase-like n=1 Tax=Dermacentor variabilis TaxID=34621 RepID=UPI003F5B2680